MIRLANRSEFAQFVQFAHQTNKPGGENGSACGKIRVYMAYWAAIGPIHGLLGRNWAMPNQYMAYWAAIGPCRTNTWPTGRSNICTPSISSSAIPKLQIGEVGCIRLQQVRANCIIESYVKVIERLMSKAKHNQQSFSNERKIYNYHFLHQTAPFSSHKPWISPGQTGR
jgi:hypothetical protein